MTICEPNKLASWRDNLIVAAPDMILFVGLAENSELAGAVVSEQVDEVERALDIAFGTVLDCVSHLE